MSLAATNDLTVSQGVTVKSDSNGNGVELQNCLAPTCGFHALGLVEVEIDGPGFNASTTVAQDGSWSFDGVPAETYTVTASAPGHLSRQLTGLVVGAADVVVTDGNPLLAGDVDGNQFNNINDITSITPNFGQVAIDCFINGKPSDFDCNNFININDITVAVSNFGVGGPRPWVE